MGALEVTFFLSLHPLVRILKRECKFRRGHLELGRKFRQKETWVTAQVCVPCVSLWPPWRLSDSRPVALESGSVTCTLVELERCPWTRRAESSEGLVTSGCSGTRQSMSGQFLAKPGDCSLDPHNPLLVFISFPTWQSVLETLTFPHVECTDAQKCYTSEEPEATVPGKTVVRKQRDSKTADGERWAVIFNPFSITDDEFKAEKMKVRPWVSSSPGMHLQGPTAKMLYVFIASPEKSPPPALLRTVKWKAKPRSVRVRQGGVKLHWSSELFIFIYVL